MKQKATLFDIILNKLSYQSNDHWSGVLFDPQLKLELESMGYDPKKMNCFKKWFLEKSEDAWYYKMRGNNK